MGIKGWARMLAEKGFLPDQAAQASCCNGSLWRSSDGDNMLSSIEAIPPGSTLHVDGNGMAFFFHQVAYARQIDDALQGQRRSVNQCAIPQEMTTAIHPFLPNFLPLRKLFEVTKEFIEALRAEKMNLVVYWDGEDREVFKQETDIKRSEHRSEEHSNLHQYCLYGRLPSRSTICQWEYEFPKTKLFKTQIMHTLTHLKVEMVNCPLEADPYMAGVASGDPHSFILGNDTDFCGFLDVQYIPFATIRTSKRGPMTASVIRRRDIAEILEIDDSLMVELAILCGNDYIVDPSKASLSFFHRDFSQKVLFLQSVESNFQLTSANPKIEVILAFVRASYNLENSGMLSEESDSESGEEDIGAVVDGILDFTMEMDDESTLSMFPIEVEVSLLRLLPMEDKSIMDTVVRCIERHVDSNAHQETGSILLEPIHVEALRKFTTGCSRDMPVTWRPEWKDIVAVYAIEKCLELSFEMNMASPVVRFCSPHTIFDTLGLLVLIHELRNAVDSVDLVGVKLPVVVDETSQPVEHVRLPIDDHEEMILQTICRNRITVIQGETGCGKSSRIPAMLLKSRPTTDMHKEVKLFISQPRRIAAKALVERLRNVEPDLRDLIALRMGHGHREYENNETRAWFVTTGYLVRLLANHPERFDDITHLIVDEVHERSVDTDILCLLCRRLLKYNASIRLVLMSATLAANLYREYFDIPNPPIKVGARRFPVEDLFLDDLTKRFVLPANIKKAVASLEVECGKMKCRSSPNSQQMEKLHMIACHIAMAVGNPGSSVLIFVPGMLDIVSISEKLEQIYVPGVSIRTFPIHSDIPFEDQMSVFAPTEPDEVKIIIATNAAESSVTLPDVDNVICLGLCKQILYNELSHRQILMPTWISRASATQRSGRTGRLRPGTSYHLYTRQNFYEHMDDFEPGEMLRIPLDSVILMLKGMLKEEEIKTVLQDCIEPPNMSTIDRSLESLYRSNFITSPSGSCEITQLGSFVSALGVDLALGSLVGLGIQFGLAAEAIQLAGVLSFPQPPWIMSNPLVHDAKSFNEMTKRTYISRCHFDANMYSEPLAAMNLLWEFEKLKHSSRGINAFCHRYGLVIARLRRLLSTCNNLRLRVATYLDMDPELLTMDHPPSQMPHAKVTLLRVLQAWVFSDSIIECRPEAKFKGNNSSDGYALEFCQRSATVTEAHLDQVLSKDRHPFTLSGYVEFEYKGSFKPSRGDDYSCRSIEERILSYATDKSLSIAWLWDRDDLIVYVKESLFEESIFETMAEKLRERLEGKILVLSANTARRGIGERACGRWKICSESQDHSEIDCVRFQRFALGDRKAPKKKLDNVRKYHLHQFLKEHSSVKGLSCGLSWEQSGAVMFELTTFGLEELKDREIRDLLAAPAVSVSKSQRKTSKQSLLFLSTANSPLLSEDDVKDTRSATSWDRPLIKCIPEGARLLSVLASCRRREHIVALEDPTREGNDKTPETLHVHLDPKQTKLSGRWKRLGTENNVYTTENSVPATALPDNGEDILFCVASNTLEIKGGSLKVEGLTLLPPGLLFLVLTRLSFGLHDSSTLKLLTEQSQAFKHVATESMVADWRERTQKAVEFYGATKNLGVELRCFPDMVHMLCSLFDGVDGFEGGSWDVESNPLAHKNFRSVNDASVGKAKRGQRRSTSSHRNASSIPSGVLPVPLSQSDLSLSKSRQAREPPQPQAQLADNTLEMNENKQQKKKKEKDNKYPLVAPRKRLKANKIVSLSIESLFSIELLQYSRLQDTDIPSSNVLAFIVSTYRQSIVGKQATEMRLDDSNDWALYEVKVDGQVCYMATFLSSDIAYPKLKNKMRNKFPSWFFGKPSMRPTKLEPALSCLPPEFRTACGKSMKFVTIGQQKALVFDTLEMAVRFESCFWLQRQFFDRDGISWFEYPDPMIMLEKLRRRTSGTESAEQQE